MASKKVILQPTSSMSIEERLTYLRRLIEDSGVVEMDQDVQPSQENHMDDRSLGVSAVGGQDALSNGGEVVATELPVEEMPTVLQPQPALTTAPAKDTGPRRRGIRCFREAAPTQVGLSSGGEAVATAVPVNSLSSGGEAVATAVPVNNRPSVQEPSIAVTSVDLKGTGTQKVGIRCFREAASDQVALSASSEAVTGAMPVEKVSGQEPQTTSTTAGTKGTGAKRRGIRCFREVAKAIIGENTIGMDCDESSLGQSDSLERTSEQSPVPPSQNSSATQYTNSSKGVAKVAASPGPTLGSRPAPLGPLLDSRPVPLMSINLGLPPTSFMSCKKVNSTDFGRKAQFQNGDNHGGLFSSTGCTSALFPPHLRPVDEKEGSNRSRLLEDFHNNRCPNLQLCHLVNHVVEFSQDELGSKFINDKLEHATLAEKQMVFDEILNSTFLLMTHIYGTTVIKTLFKFGSAEQREVLLTTRIKGHVVPLALHPAGSFLIRTTLSSMTKLQLNMISLELSGHVLKCAMDRNGSKVMTTCLRKLGPTAAWSPFINVCLEHVFSLSTHPYGFYVIKFFIHHRPQIFFEELQQHLGQLIPDEYGSGIVLNLIGCCNLEQRAHIASLIHGSVVKLSLHKFASKVVRKCVKYLSSEHRAILIEEMFNIDKRTLLTVIKDTNANYVMQEMLVNAEQHQGKIVWQKIRSRIPELLTSGNGRYVLTKLEECMKNKKNGRTNKMRDGVVLQPSVWPQSPTDLPTHDNTDLHTHSPTDPHLHNPTHNPTDCNSHNHTDSNPHFPTGRPTHYPTDLHPHSPTDCPRRNSTDCPTDYTTDHNPHFPTGRHPFFPTDRPSAFPTDGPSAFPTDGPSAFPMDRPSAFPTDRSSAFPTDRPSVFPNDRPSHYLNDRPSHYLNDHPPQNASNLVSPLPLDAVDLLCERLKMKDEMRKQLFELERRKMQELEKLRALERELMKKRDEERKRGNKRELSEERESEWDERDRERDRHMRSLKYDTGDRFAGRLEPEEERWGGAAANDKPVKTMVFRNRSRGALASSGR